MCIRRRLQGGIIASFLFLLSLSFADTCVAFTRGGSALFRFPVLTEDVSGNTSATSWALRWQHSVTGITVTDYFRVVDGMMLLSHSHMPRFDAGLGHIPERGRVTSDANGAYWVWDINHVLPYLAIRIGSTSVNHRVLWQGAVYSLSQVAAGERVIMQLQDCH